MEFLKSANFHDKFFLPNINLERYALMQHILRKSDPHENALELLKEEYINHCKYNFKAGIHFYDELAGYMIDDKGEFRKLDDYILLKLRYYATKFLVLLNEASNFFCEERKKFREGNYPEAIADLSKGRHHDAHADFEYNDNILKIIFYPDSYREIFEFHGVKDWSNNINIKHASCLIIDEVFEEANGIFVYNTLWACKGVNDKENLELSFRFTDLVKLKR